MRLLISLVFLILVSTPALAVNRDCYFAYIGVTKHSNELTRKLIKEHYVMDDVSLVQRNMENVMGSNLEQMRRMSWDGPEVTNKCLAMGEDTKKALDAKVKEMTGRNF